MNKLQDKLAASVRQARTVPADGQAPKPRAARPADPAAAVEPVSPGAATEPVAQGSPPSPRPAPKFDFPARVWPD